MKNTILILLFIFLKTVIFSNNAPDNQLTKKVIQLTDSITHLQTQVHQLIEQQEWKKQILEERLKQASDTISNQSSLLTGFGTLYTIITIIIAVVAIILPIITYQFGIKPSRRALKEFESNADKKMSIFLANDRNKQVDLAIENLKSDLPQQRANAVNYLTLTQYHGFTEEQRFKLFFLLKSGNIDHSAIGVVAHLVSGKKNDYVTDYFKTAIKESDNSGIKNTAIRYFTNLDAKDYKPIYRELILSSEKSATEFISVIGQLYSISKIVFTEVINDNELIDKFDAATILELKGSVSLLRSIMWRQAEKEIENSYLVKKIGLFENK